MFVYKAFELNAHLVFSVFVHARARSGYEVGSWKKHRSLLST